MCVCIYITICIHVLALLSANTLCVHIPNFLLISPYFSLISVLHKASNINDMYTSYKGVQCMLTYYTCE